jgi:microcystin-dependent protein
MATVSPSNSFDDVYEIETTDPVKGGTIAGALTSPTDGHANVQAQSLANRTEYLFQRLLPVGSILPYVGTTAPTGFLICNGASVSRTTYAALFAICSTRFGTVNGTSFNIPDFRGAFLRGWDNGAGIDPDAASRTATSFGGATGDSIGTEQADAFAEHDHGGGAHTHNISAEAADETGNGAITGGTNTSDPNTTVATSSSGSIITSSGGNETRPFNIAVNYIIKALP